MTNTIYKDILENCTKLADLCGQNLYCLNKSLEDALEKTEPAVTALYQSLSRTDIDAEESTSSRSLSHDTADMGTTHNI